jgi:hypothetical protein
VNKLYDGFGEIMHNEMNLKLESKVIDIDNAKLAILLDVDDVVLLAENEKDLQKMLDVLNFWCKNDALYVNVNKSKIMHFRNPSVPRTDFNFTVNDNSMECVNCYQYLGLLLT